MLAPHPLPTAESFFNMAVPWVLCAVLSTSESAEQQAADHPPIVTKISVKNCTCSTARRALHCRDTGSRGREHRRGDGRKALRLPRREPLLLRARALRVRPRAWPCATPSF